MKDRPKSERIYVPTDQFGSCYEGQWVERTVEISDHTNQVVHQVLSAPLYQGKDFDTTTSVLSLISATVITDWNLEVENGPLPSPWRNSGAFRKLLESDISLFEWTTGVAAELCGYDRKGAENNGERTRNSNHSQGGS